MAQAQLAKNDPGLVKGLGLIDATTIVMGSMIGSGIFIVSAEIARQVEAPFWLLAAWLLAGVITILGALSFGELAAILDAEHHRIDRKRQRVAMRQESGGRA